MTPVVTAASELPFADGPNPCEGKASPAALGGDDLTTFASLVDDAIEGTDEAEEVSSELADGVAAFLPLTQWWTVLDTLEGKINDVAPDEIQSEQAPSEQTEDADIHAVADTDSVALTPSVTLPTPSPIDLTVASRGFEPTPSPIERGQQALSDVLQSGQTGQAGQVGQVGDLGVGADVGEAGDAGQGGQRESVRDLEPTEQATKVGKGAVYRTSQRSYSEPSVSSTQPSPLPVPASAAPANASTTPAQSTPPVLSTPAIPAAQSPSSNHAVAALPSDSSAEPVVEGIAAPLTGAGGGSGRESSTNFGFGGHREDPRAPETLESTSAMRAMSAVATIPATSLGDGLSPTLAGAASASASAQPVKADDVLPQIVQAMRLQMRQGIGEARVYLKPEHLGAVTISLRLEHGSVSATIHAEAPVVRQWIESHESVLRQSLTEHGLQLQRLVVHGDGSSPNQEREASEERLRRQRRHRASLENAPTFEVVA